MVPTDTVVEEGSLLVGRDESSGWKSRLTDVGGEGLQVFSFSFFFLLNLVEIELLLSTSFLFSEQVHFLLLFFKEVRFLLGLLLFVHVGILSCQFFDSKSGIHEAKREPRELTTVSFLSS